MIDTAFIFIKNLALQNIVSDIHDTVDLFYPAVGSLDF